MINSQIHTCLWFNNCAKEAADFYCKVFKNGKILSENPGFNSFVPAEISYFVPSDQLSGMTVAQYRNFSSRFLNSFPLSW